jgi:hypothetical protein
MEKSQPDVVTLVWKLCQQCFHCKTLRVQTDLSICMSCGQGHCDTCPTACDCSVKESLEVLSQGD